MPPEDDNREEEDVQEAEIVSTDPVEEPPNNHSPSEELDRVATYTVEENGVTYKILPQITNLETVWTLWAFGAAQGPIQLPQGISDEQAEHLGLSPVTQEELNETLNEAKERGELPSAFRGQPRDNRRLEDLQKSLGMQ